LSLPKAQPEGTQEEKSSGNGRRVTQHVSKSFAGHHRFFFWRNRCGEDCLNEDWEFVLVGHSMGAIIVNEIVRHYGEKLPISHIVYMAAACSIRDYEDSVWPYLRLGESQKAETYVHHLMLHPSAERPSQGTGKMI
jgi:pimeloyl-ACP methyl ester carboxylesterase